MEAEQCYRAVQAGTIRRKMKDVKELADSVCKLDRDQTGHIEPGALWQVIQDFTAQDEKRDLMAGRALWCLVAVFLALLTVATFINYMIISVLVDSHTTVSVIEGTLVSRETGSPLHIDPLSFSVAHKPTSALVSGHKVHALSPPSLDSVHSGK